MSLIPGMQGWLNNNVIHHINGIKNTKSHDLSRDSEKAIDKIQPLFMVKTLSKLKWRGLTQLSVCLIGQSGLTL